MDPLLALLPKARRRWAQTDPLLASIAREYPPVGRAAQTANGFQSLIASIAHQQVSIHAGAAIMRRVVDGCGGEATADSLLKLGPEKLRAAGFSRPKVAYAMDLAERTAKGALDFEALREATDAEVIDALTAVKGIGVWTAKMFLIFHLSRPDVLPHEDLGVQIGVAQLYKVPRARAVAKALKQAPAWSPYSSVAALTLWNWRRATDPKLATKPR